jgi:hypothetical protein
VQRTARSTGWHNASVKVTLTGRRHWLGREQGLLHDERVQAAIEHGVRGLVQVSSTFTVKFSISR